MDKMLEHLGRALDQSITVLVERGGIGTVSGILVFSAGLLLRLHHNEFPNLEGWESDAYKVVSLVAIAMGLAITVSVGIRSLHTGERRGRYSRRGKTTGTKSDLLSLHNPQAGGDS
jgi:hypothetical protein